MSDEPTPVAAPGGPLEPLPAAYASTRAALHALACYAIAPARKAAVGRIGLRATGDGFGTPAFDDGARIVVRGDRLVREPDEAVAITSLRPACEFLGVELTADPGVGTDLPPYEPDAPLAVDAGASAALGAWYEFGRSVLEEVRAELAEEGTVSEIQLWPEHFDLAFDHQPATGDKVNLGCSPGDGFHADPYLYVGPWSTAGLEGEFWNAPFGAYLAYGTIQQSEAQRNAAKSFFTEGLSRLAPP
jgi:hypothetical protein